MEYSTEVGIGYWVVDIGYWEMLFGERSDKIHHQLAKFVSGGDLEHAGSAHVFWESIEFFFK